MMLALLVIIPLGGGFLAWFLSRWDPLWARWAALASSLSGFGLALALWVQHFTGSAAVPGGKWLEQTDVAWIPQLGVRFHLAIDGLSLIMLMLTFVLTALAVVASWRGVNTRVGFFHFHLMWAAAGLAGVFMALDLFLFYFFFEMMLVPLYFLIAIWGHERRVRAAVKFFIFTQVAGLLMLVAIVGLYFIHGRATGSYTFDYLQLLGTGLSSRAGIWLMLGFFIAFAVKLPAVPFHSWLPDAHTEAPTAGSVILAGLLIKAGAYGMIRFMFPLFPQASFRFAGIGMALGVAGILYGALLAFAQTDLKRLVAYTSVSHMGFVLLGIFAWNELALQGVILQIVCHAFSTGGLFMIVGALEERLGTRDMGKLGGFWALIPRFGGTTMVLAMAALGLPALGNFVAEFLILLGAYRVSPPAAIIAAVGLVLATVYALWMIQRVFHGNLPADATSFRPRPSKTGPSNRLADLSAREIGMLAVCLIVVLWLGLYPQTLVRTAKQTIDSLQELAKPQADTVFPQNSPTSDDEASMTGASAQIRREAIR
jgi:NADH-quinone oxidoreductase subunit M